MSHVAQQALRLSVNGESLQAPAGSSVRTLIEHLHLDGRRVAVAINRSVVPRSEYSVRRLRNGDRIEVLEAVGGG